MSEINQFDQFQVDYVSRLAMLQFDPSHRGDLQQQLSKILEFVSQLQQVDVPAGTEPFYGTDWGDRLPATLENRVTVDSFINAERGDIPATSLSLSEVLRNAPQSDGQYFVVPPVFE